jgi:glycosyltransferase involved in cell wall biosynthesis
MIRVLHITSGNSGGAWVSSSMLNEALAERIIDSKIINLQDVTKNGPYLLTKLNVLIRKSNTLASRILAQQEYEFLSFHSVSSYLKKTIRSINPNILHIHNWYNILSLKDIKILGQDYPIVFTMHDSRLATGGCHFTLDCERYKQGCRKCPAAKWNKTLISESYKRTEHTFAKLKSFAVIAPTAWQIDVFSASRPAVLPHHIEVVRNLSPFQTSTARIRIKSEVVKILFIAANLQSKVKNLQVLLDALDLISTPQKKFQLHLIGSGSTFKELTKVNYLIVHHGFLNSNKIQEVMQSCDILVVPSKSENFPNVILEAFAQDLIVLGSSVGGIPEMIDHSINGFLFNPNKIDLSTAIEEALFKMEQWPLIRAAARGKLKVEWNRETVVTKTIEIYSKLIKAFENSQNP